MTPSPAVIDRARFEAEMRAAGWYACRSIFGKTRAWVHVRTGAAWDDPDALRYWQMTGRTPHPF